MRLYGVLLKQSEHLMQCKKISPLLWKIPQCRRTFYGQIVKTVFLRRLSFSATTLLVKKVVQKRPQAFLNHKFKNNIPFAAVLYYLPSGSLK